MVMEKRNKKAQSQIISVVLIILIVLALIVLVWTFVIPLIRERSEQIDTRGLTTDLEIEEVLLFITGNSKVVVKAGAGDGEILELNFVFLDENGNSHLETKNEIIKSLETKPYSFNPIPDFGEIKEVSVYPVFGKVIGREFKSEVSSFFEVPESSVGWWRFNDNSDFIGENNGNVVDGSLNEEGELVVNDGVGFRIENSSNLDLSDNFAISLWVYPEGGDGELISKGDNYNISLVNSEVIFSYGGINVKSDFLNQGEWSHVLVNKDDLGLRIYLNGVSLGGDTSDPIPIGNDDPVLIGSNFNGKIDDVMIFNKNLHPTQIDSIYNVFRK